VQLSRGEIKQARLTAIPKRPYIVLAAGLIKYAGAPVRIMIPPEQSRLTDYSISPATFDIAMSLDMWKTYDPKVTNLTQVLLPISIKASEEAKRRYENQELPHMTLHIFDDDAEKGSREVVYNFPEELVRSGEIALILSPAQPVVAKFELIPLAPGETPPGRVE